MTATSALEVAKWYIQKGMDSPRNTKSGNMKLQKLLYFSQLVHLARTNERLFDEEIKAFEYGSVIEEVRQPYQHNHASFIGAAYTPIRGTFKDALETLRIVEEVFGDLSAHELSDINHQHKSWSDAYNGSISGGYSWKESATISIEQIMANEVPMFKDIIHARENSCGLSSVVLNGIKFYYDPQSLEITPEIKKMLESFDGPDSAYTIYNDESQGLVIY